MFPFESPGRGFKGITIPRDEYEVMSVCGELPCELEADSGGGARDESRLSGLWHPE